MPQHHLYDKDPFMEADLPFLDVAEWVEIVAEIRNGSCGESDLGHVGEVSK